MCCWYQCFGMTDNGLWVMGYGYDFGLCPRGFCSDCSLALTSPVRIMPGFRQRLVRLPLPWNAKKTLVPLDTGGERDNEEKCLPRPSAENISQTPDFWNFWYDLGWFGDVLEWFKNAESQCVIKRFVGFVKVYSPVGLFTFCKTCRALYSGGRYPIWFNSMFEFCQKIIHSILDSILL